MKKKIFGKRMNSAILVVILLFTVIASAGCSNNSKDSGGQSAEDPADREPIQIATKVTAEQYILGEMLGLLIEEHNGYPVEITKGFQDANTVQPALEKGEFDMYPEYTSAGFMSVLKHDNPLDYTNEEMLELLKKEYHEKFGITWVGLYGFNNTYAVAVDSGIAKKYNLKTVSDLAKVAGELRFGANPDYIEREDSFPRLCENYNLSFKSVSDVDISLRYAAVENGEIDVTVAFTTDSQLSVADVTLLEDDKNTMASYICSTVVREDTLEEYPGLEDTLMLMDGLLDDATMSSLNYKVEVDGEDEKDVAREFLISKGLIKE